MVFLSYPLPSGGRGGIQLFFPRFCGCSGGHEIELFSPLVAVDSPSPRGWFNYFLPTPLAQLKMKFILVVVGCPMIWLNFLRNISLVHKTLEIISGTSPLLATSLLYLIFLGLSQLSNYSWEHLCLRISLLRTSSLYMVFLRTSPLGISSFYLIILGNIPII